MDSRTEHFLSCPLFGFDVFKRLCSIIEHSQLSITASGEHLVLPIAFHRIGDSCRKKNRPFVATHVTKQEGTDRHGEHQERAEIVIDWLAS